ncbi:hypothetical protein [Paraburkholderia lacunae]|uniref:hypothetical protein n=1 Tax=Paraburkholderia lacunae TaxID=2211104 RepID=UPI001402D17A|nr:hypothetical protein [Paraburkholderia lacunae]
MLLNKLYRMSGATIVKPFTGSAIHCESDRRRTPVANGFKRTIHRAPSPFDNVRDYRLFQVCASDMARTACRSTRVIRVAALRAVSYKRWGGSDKSMRYACSTGELARVRYRLVIFESFLKIASALSGAVAFSAGIDRRDSFKESHRENNRHGRLMQHAKCACPHIDPHHSTIFFVAIHKRAGLALTIEKTQYGVQGMSAAVTQGSRRVPAPANDHNWVDTHHTGDLIRRCS